MAEDDFQIDLNFSADGVSGNTTDSGNKETNKLLKEILKSLKETDGEQKKQNKLSLSGLLKSGGVMAGALGIANLVATNAVKGGGGHGASMFREEVYGSGNLGYDLYQDPETGEKMVAEIDEKRGTIVNVLTEQEAREQGILTTTGEIERYSKVQSTQWERNTGTLKRSAGYLVATEDDLYKATGIVKEQNAEIEAQLDYQQRIKNELKIYYEMLAERNGSSVKSVGTSYVNPIQEAIAAASLPNSSQGFSYQNAQNRIMNQAEKSSNFVTDWFYSIK